MNIGKKEIDWILENETNFHPDFSFKDQTSQILRLLGSPDSHLRESSLTIIARWIERHHYSDDQLVELADKLKDDILVGLGEKYTDSVFLRAFAVLILGDIIGQDEAREQGKVEGKQPFLTKELILDYLKNCLKYYEGEKDVRGYIEVKEWAHSIAHGADVFRKLAKHRYLGKEELQKILEVFQDKLIEPQEDIYKAREELRITVAVYTVFLRRLLDTEEIISWLMKFDEYSKDKKWYNFAQEPSWINAQLNLRMFLTCIYLMVKHGIVNTGYFDDPLYQNNLLEDRGEIAPVIESLLLNIDKGIYHPG